MQKMKNGASNSPKATKLSGGGGGSNSKHGGAAAEVKKDRRSNSGVVGSPKKGGHGGKFTWAGEGYSPAELGSFEKEAVDAKDPNFEDPETITP